MQSITTSHHISSSLTTFFCNPEVSIFLYPINTPIIFLVVKILCVVVDVKPKTLEFFGFLATLLSPADEDDAPPQPFLAAGDPALGADARPFHRRAVRENEDDIGDGPRERIVPVGVPESVRVPSSEEQHDESIDGVKED